MHGLKSPIKFVGSTVDERDATVSADDNIAIPTMANGERPKYVACMHTVASQTVRINFGQSGATAVLDSTGFPVPPHNVTIFDVTGFTHYAIIGSATTSFTIVPLENF